MVSRKLAFDSPKEKVALLAPDALKSKPDVPVDGAVVLDAAVPNPLVAPDKKPLALKPLFCVVVAPNTF